MIWTGTVKGMVVSWCEPADTGLHAISLFKRYYYL